MFNSRRDWAHLRAVHTRDIWCIHAWTRKISGESPNICVPFFRIFWTELSLASSKWLALVTWLSLVDRIFATDCDNYFSPGFEHVRFFLLLSLSPPAASTPCPVTKVVLRAQPIFTRLTRVAMAFATRSQLICIFLLISPLGRFPRRFFHGIISRLRRFHLWSSL